MFRSGPVIVLSLALSAAALVAAPSAVAGDDGVVKDIDPCGTGAIKVRIEAYGDGRFEVSGVVYSQDSDVWSWRLRHNEDVSASGEVRADGDGEGRSFKIVRTMVDLPGSEFIAFRAENERTGLSCRAERHVG